MKDFILFSRHRVEATGCRPLSFQRVAITLTMSLNYDAINNEPVTNLNI